MLSSGTLDHSLEIHRPKVIQVVGISLPGISEPLEDAFIPERTESDFVPHAFVEEVDFPPVCFENLPSPVVVQVVETEPVAYLRG